MTQYAALEPWWHTYIDDDRAGGHLLDRLGVGGLAERDFARCRRASASGCWPAPS